MNHLVHATVGLALALALGAGCATTQNQVVGSSDYMVKTVTFDGAERFSHGELLKHLYVGETKWVPMTPDHPFDEALVVSDARRVEQLYAAYGYHQAHVVDIDISRDDRKRHVHLRFEVEEGEPTLVEALEFRWRGDVHDDIATETEERATLKRQQTFEVARYNETLGAMRQSLLNAGYPLAVVTGQATVEPQRRAATAHYDLDPGPRATIGEIRFEGLDEVPEYLVQREVDFVRGEPYSPNRVRQMEQSVKAMRVFRWVSTVPPTEVVDGKVDLVMRVSEADPHAIRLGLELGVDTVRWQQQGRLEYTNTNVFGHLTRLDLVSTAGWAELPNPFQNELNGPVAVVRPKFTKKGLLERNLSWSLTPSARLDLQEGYQYYRLGERLGVSRWFDGFIRLAAAHSTEYVNFFNVSPELGANASILGRDFRDPYLLSDISVRAQAFFTDTITNPKNGAILESLYTISGRAIGSDFNFHRVLLKARGYWRPWKRLQFASRVQSGVIALFGERAGSPFDRRFYLGGSNSVRGWGSRRLSPRLEECDADGECESVPIGGNTMIQANVQATLHLVGPLSLVGFFDVGDVQPDELTLVQKEWNYSAGPGLRLKTPMGLVRLDLGIRLNDTGVYDEKMWAIYLGLGEIL